EDVRGTLSRLMHHVEGCYAQYFNMTRLGRRRRGPLFENRFDAQLIDSPEYFEAACAYVLLNPMRTREPLAMVPEAYGLSSARSSAVTSRPRPLLPVCGQSTLAGSSRRDGGHQRPPCLVSVRVGSAGS